MQFFPDTLDQVTSDAMVDRCAAQIAAHGYGIWATEVTQTGEFIGFVGLGRPTFEAAFTPCTEIGWRLKRSVWGHGYATEAARAALDVAFGILDLDEVVSFTAVVNSRSRAVMERLGMTRDTGDDFEHPRIPVGHPLRPHVLYRLRPPAGTRGCASPSSGLEGSGRAAPVLPSARRLVTPR